MFEFEDKDSEEDGGEAKTSSRAHSENKLTRIALKAFGALLLVAIGAGGIYYGVKTKPEWFGIKNDAADQAKLQKEVENLVKEVNRIIQLPEGETPTLATVTDLDKVKEQPFFKNAQNGDKVLVYSQSKKAYLYRPSEKKVIEVGVVNINQPDQGNNQEPEITLVPTTPTPTIQPTIKPQPRPTASPTSEPTPTAQP